MGTTRLWEPPVYENHSSMRTTGQWKPLVYGNHWSMGTTRLWEPPVYGNHWSRLSISDLIFVLVHVLEFDIFHAGLCLYGGVSCRGLPFLFLFRFLFLSHQVVQRGETGKATGRGVGRGRIRREARDRGYVVPFSFRSGFLLQERVDVLMGDHLGMFLKRSTIMSG